MTVYTSAVLILPAAYRQAGNDLSAEMGWQPVDADPGTYSVPLMTADVLTHWGCRADVTQTFIDMVENPTPETQPLIDVLIYDFRVTGDPYTHFMDVIGENGLTIRVDVTTTP
jgi:hypothetical protein